MNYTRTVYRAQYRVHGVPAILTVGITPYSLRAIEMTDGVDLGGVITIETTRPMASILYADLLALGLTRDDLDGSNININGVEREISSHKPMSSPQGILDGEIYLFLTEP